MTADSKLATFLVLDPVVGWKATPPEHLSPEPDGTLEVDCVPGQPRKFADAVADELCYPIALACDQNQGNLVVADEPESQIRILNLQRENEITTISDIGGKGRGARQFRHARGVAVLADGSLAIADTGNHQVKIFSALPHALLAVWGTGHPGKNRGEFRSPWKVVADRCDLIYVADRDNGRIQRIHRDGRYEDPIEGLSSPSGLALHTDGTLAVLDGTTVQIFRAGQIRKPESFSVPDASCLTFDDQGYLYVGTSTALVYTFAPDSAGGYRDVGIGVTGMDAKFLDLVWTHGEQLIGILLIRCNPKPVLRTLSTCGTYLKSGTLTTRVLDSGIEGCVWHRIELEASIPAGTLIKVATQTAEQDIWSSDKNSTFQPECSSFSAASKECALALTGNNSDCLVQSKPGRYLRIQLELKTNGLTSPALRRIRVHFPRQSYLQYLPAIYQEDDESRLFLERFLSIFQTSFDGFDRQIDELWMLFDPMSVPDKWYPWLAGWMALPINPKWSDQQRRSALKDAGKLYPQRGTPAGIEQLIKDYSGIDARLVEHFRLRRLLILPDQPNPNTVLCGGGALWSRDYYQRLQLGVYSRVGCFRLTGEPEPGLEPLSWGANEFSVFFDCEPYCVPETRQKVAQVIEREKPAHTRANYCPVLPRMRVGVQSTLGVDSRVGAITPLLLGTTGTLGYDSILGCSAAEIYSQSQHSTVRPRVDVNTRLL